MQITPTMDLGALAERMGDAATEQDARAMRDALVDAGHADTADVPEAEWMTLLSAACGPADHVTVGNWTGPVAIARNLMDDEIAESLHMRVATEQEFVDRYCAAHAAKYGTDFVVS